MVPGVYRASDTSLWLYDVNAYALVTTNRLSHIPVGYWPRPDPEGDKRDFDLQRHAASIAADSGMPPVPLELASLPLPRRQLELTPHMRVDARARYSAKQRRPVRSRHKLRTWERA